MIQIQFLGAADAVTGSRHLVTMGDQRILLDCGLFQGYKVLRERNWVPLAVPPQDIDAVVLSHAHLDHCGWLPRLVKSGFKGPVYASAATRDLAEVMLLDSAHLQEEDARRANRYGYSQHAKAEPLYTQRDAQRAIARIVPLRPSQQQAIGAVKLDLSPAGHLLGANAVNLRHGSSSLVFSGDLGRNHDLLMPAPKPPPPADVLLVESTYGNRRHPPEDVQAALAGIVRSTIARGGTVLLPSFAVGRAQALLLVLQRLKAAGEIPPLLPIYLDSPMAIAATALYSQHRRLLRVPQREMATLADGVKMLTTATMSQQLTRTHYPCVIISASGMATGGRVLHHLKSLAPEPRNSVVFAGFQVGGTRGAHLVAGAREVKIHGQMVPVRAEIHQLEGFSGHADADELMAWLGQLHTPPQQTFVVHGEPDAADSLRLRIKTQLGWQVRVPQHGERVQF